METISILENSRNIQNNMISIWLHSSTTYTFIHGNTTISSTTVNSHKSNPKGH